MTYFFAAFWPASHPLAPFFCRRNHHLHTKTRVASTPAAHHQEDPRPATAASKGLWQGVGLAFFARLPIGWAFQQLFIFFLLLKTERAVAAVEVSCSLSPDQKKNNIKPLVENNIDQCGEASGQAQGHPLPSLPHPRAQSFNLGLVPRGSDFSFSLLVPLWVSGCANKLKDQQHLHSHGMFFLDSRISPRKVHPMKASNKQSPGATPEGLLRE